MVKIKLTKVQKEFSKALSEFDKTDAKLFAIKIAKVMLKLKSSHCYFILQQAFGEHGKWMGWSDAEKLLTRIVENGKK
jgi:hypothetical protein